MQGLPFFQNQIERAITEGAKGVTRRNLIAVLNAKFKADEVRSLIPMLESIDDLQRLEQLLITAAHVNSLEAFTQMLFEKKVRTEDPILAESPFYQRLCRKFRTEGKLIVQGKSQGIVQGAKAATRKNLIAVLNAKFNTEAVQALTPKLETVEDLKRLQQFYINAITVNSIEDFTKMLCDLETRVEEREEDFPFSPEERQKFIEQGIEEGKEEGAKAATRKNLIIVLKTKFSIETLQALMPTLENIDDLQRLELLLLNAITVNSIETFTKTLFENV